MNTFPSPDTYRREQGYVTVDFAFCTGEDEKDGTGFSGILTRLPLCREMRDAAGSAARRFCPSRPWALKKRLEHTGCGHAVVGLSGGLDPRWPSL